MLASQNDWETFCLFLYFYYFLYLLQYSIPFCPVLLLCLPSFCQKERMCLILVFRKGFNTRIFDFDEWQNRWFSYPYWDFFHNYSFYNNLVYGQFARTTSNWCTHDVNVTYVYCAFNLYVDGEHMRLAVNVRTCITQGTSEISLRHLCNSNRTVILRNSWV